MSTVRMSMPRRRRWVLYVVGALVLLAILFTVLSGFYIDLLWYREVDFSSVFWTTIRTKVLLGLVFGLIFFALLYVNLLIARRLTPTTRVLTPDQEVVERIRETFEPYLKWILLGGSLLLAFTVGVGVSHEWQTFLLWRHSSGVTFGQPEPLFGRDPAFYVFTLPWFKFLQGWLFSSLIGVFILVAIAHFLFGGISPQAPGLSEKVTPAVRAHLSVLLGLIMLVKAWGYWLGRFDLLTSHRGVVEGASYTDVHAQLPALNFLAIVAVICAILFFLNIRLRIWGLPIIAVGLLAVVSVLLGTAYPAFVQRFHVAPQEYQAEQPYIKDNIDATRTAFGLDKIRYQTNRPVDPAVTAKDIINNGPTISNIRLWRAIPVLQENFQALQRFRQYYEFPDVDVDRYNLAGQERVQMVSAREVTQSGIPTGGGTWQNQHLVYTHGYGPVAAQVNAATTEGAPVFTVSNIPPAGDGPQLDAAHQNLNAVYYGEGHTGDAAFVIVNSKTPELNYEGAPPGQTHVPYTGGGGIPMGNFFQRALFAWRFRDVNLLISDQITAQSRIMIYRDLAQRVPKAVPFLKFDGDPYLVIEPDGLKWVWDAYTTTDQYPYSQSVNLRDATQNAMNGNTNYLRNSVKVVVDAYTGKMTYYADLTDPIIQVWANAFPDLFTPIADAPVDISQHFRVPENLFQVQATQFANYHVTDTQVFYQKQDFWQIPPDPTTPPDAATVPLRPYYVLMKVPGDTTEHFWLILPFVPQGRQNMVSWMAADSDAQTPGSQYGYGSTIAAQFPTGENIDGPSQVFSRINQNPQFSSRRTLLSQGGSGVLFGDFLVIPVENSFLYVQPVYVRATQSSVSSTAVPELKLIVVANGDSIGLGTTLKAALANSVAGEIGGGNGGGGGGGGGGGTTEQQINDLLSRALTHFSAADAALKTGNLALYQSELKLAQNLVQQAATLAAGTPVGPNGSPTPTPSPSVSASASP